MPEQVRSAECPSEPQANGLTELLGFFIFFKPDAFGVPDNRVHKPYQQHDHYGREILEVRVKP